MLKDMEQVGHPRNVSLGQRQQSSCRKNPGDQREDAHLSMIEPFEALAPRSFVRDQLFYYEKRLTVGARFDLRHVGFARRLVFSATLSTPQAGAGATSPA